MTFQVPHDPPHVTEKTYYYLHLVNNRECVSIWRDFIFFRLKKPTKKLSCRQGRIWSHQNSLNTFKSASIIHNHHNKSSIKCYRSKSWLIDANTGRVFLPHFLLNTINLHRWKEHRACQRARQSREKAPENSSELSTYSATVSRQTLEYRPTIPNVVNF